MPRRRRPVVDPAVSVCVCVCSAAADGPGGVGGMVVGNDTNHRGRLQGLAHRLHHQLQLRPRGAEDRVPELCRPLVGDLHEPHRSSYLSRGDRLEVCTRTGLILPVHFRPSAERMGIYDVSLGAALGRTGTLNLAVSLLLLVHSCVSACGYTALLPPGNVRKCSTRRNDGVRERSRTTRLQGLMTKGDAMRSSFVKTTHIT